MSFVTNMRGKINDMADENDFNLRYPAYIAFNVRSDLSFPCMNGNLTRRRYQLRPRPMQKNNPDGLFMESAAHAPQAKIQVSTLPCVPNLPSSNDLNVSDLKMTTMPFQIRLQPRPNKKLFSHD